MPISAVTRRIRRRKARMGISHLTQTGDKPAKQLKSQRTRGGGVEIASGEWISPHDARCMEIMGCDLKKALPNLG